VVEVVGDVRTPGQVWDATQDGRAAITAVLDAAEVIRADDTCIAGWIRILRINDHFAIQVQTPDGEILVRRLISPEAAERFVQDRLSDCERRWDGCGCKIDYHN